jgi:hypothetical protein
MISIRRTLVRAAALAWLVATPTIASAALVTSVFDGRVPCVPTVGVQFCAGTLLARVETWDGVPLDANLTLPPPTMDGPFPLIVDIHGWGIGKSPQPFVEEALAGYAVLSYSARGFHFSCGLAPSRLPDPTLANPNACTERGWSRLGDARYEARDTQHLAGLLADEGLVIPDKIGVTGSSYGGGQSMILAALRNRVMLPDDTLVPWQSPGGLPMEIAAAGALIPWSDLGYALVPNGRTLDYRDLNPYGVRGGVLKKSWVDALFLLGQATGFYTAVGQDPDADIQSWKARLDQGEPYDDDPAIQDALDEVTSHHSAYYIDDSIPPAPLFIYNAWTDDLFPADEALRFWRKTVAKHPDAEIALQFADGFGHPRASLGGNMTRPQARVDELFARHLQDSGDPALPPLETFTQPCNGASELGPFAAPDWDAIHPGEVRFTDAAAQTFDSAAGSAANAMATDPVAGGLGSCRTVSAADDPAAATYRLPAASGAGYTLMGSPTIIASYAITGDFPEIVGRLWDVGTDGNQTLVAQALYRPREDGTSPEVFQLHANGWHFAAGHVAKLELLGRSTPYGRASNGTFSITVSDLELRLPVLEAPDGGVIEPPAPLVLPGAECGATPVAVCRAPTLPQKSKLVLKDKIGPRDRLSWTWTKGAATSKSDLGNPLADTGYALCVYDGDDHLISSATAPPGGICAGHPCWKETDAGFRYVDAELTPTGLRKLELKSGVAGKSKIGVLGKGDLLAMPGLPILDLPVTVQLVHDGGGCWGATFGTTQRNQADLFKAKSD